MLTKEGGKTEREGERKMDKKKKKMMMMEEEEEDRFVEGEEIV